LGDLGQRGGMRPGFLGEGGERLGSPRVGDADVVAEGGEPQREGGADVAGAGDGDVHDGFSVWMGRAA